MSANYTPLSVFLSNRDASARRRQQNTENMANVGRLAGFVAGLVKNKKYDDNVKDFFSSLGDGEIEQGENTLAEIDRQIADIEAQLKELGAM